jgi:cytochrome c553
MKITNLILVAAIVISITNCKTKKNTVVSAKTESTAAAPTSKDGIYAPGEKEVMSLQMQYPDVTLDKLKEGHQLYTLGACVNCHGAKNIYKRDESRWKSIIDDMAKMAKLTEAQTDAVYKYVLAIKANQPK